MEKNAKASSLPVIACLVFLWVYNINFQAAPALTTGRVVLVLLFVVNLGAFWAILKVVLRKAWVLFFVLGVSTLWLLILYSYYGEDPTQLSRFFYLIAYVFPAAVGFYAWVKGDVVQLLKAFSIATGIQAIFVLISFFSPDFRLFTAEYLVQGGHIPLSAGYRVAGFSNGSGAALSLIQALGVLACLAVVDIRRSPKQYVAWLALAMFVLLSTIFIGRTGLLIGSFVFFAYSAKWVLELKTKFVWIFALFFAGVCSFMVFVSYMGPDMKGLVSWAFAFFLEGGDEKSLNSLNEMSIPPVSEETVIGTGLVTRSFGNASGHDSGYIQTYYAAGLPISMLFYVSIALIMAYFALAYKYSFLFYILIVIVFVAEVKEPFIFKYVEMFLLFVFLTDSAFYHRRPCG